MGLNMSVLVKLPAMDIFARPITVVIPGNSFPGRGYFDTRSLDVMAEDGSIVSDQQTILDIRDAEFAIVPRQDDIIDIPADGTVPAEGRFKVISSSSDGGGLTTLVIQKVEPARPASRR